MDAILDQSGQILETQHGDLSRADHSHSRSHGSSISTGWDDGENDDDDEEEEKADGSACVSRVFRHTCTINAYGLVGLQLNPQETHLTMARSMQ